MKTDGWRDRLSASLIEKKRSKRSVSLQSGNAEGYVHSILVEGKEPTVDRLSQVCDALGVSLSFILYGLDVTPEDEEILSAIQESPAKRDAVLTLLRGR
jgi:hypothetical protein